MVFFFDILFLWASYALYRFREGLLDLISSVIRLFIELEAVGLQSLSIIFEF